MTDTGSQERTCPMSANKPGDRLKLIACSSLGFLEPLLRGKANHPEFLPSDSQLPLEEG